MFPMLALCAVLSAVTVSEIGDLKDSDRVVTSVTGLSAVTNRIEDRLVPGPGGSLYADRTVKADLSVTDVRYFETVTPQVSTNYDITVEPIIEIIGHEYLNAPMNLYIKYSTAEGETILKSYGIIGGGYEWNTQSYPPSGKILGVRYIDLVGLSGPDAKMTVNYNMDQVFADEQVFGGSGHADVAAVVRESFIEVLRNRERTVVIPEIRSVAGKTVGISIRAGEADVSPAYTLVDIPKYGTNGWNVVTNSITVVTNGFVYATNSVCVATSLVTEDEMTNALASAGRVNVSRGETRPVFTNGTFGVIADVSVDSDALSPSVGVRSPAVIRIPDMQSVVVGGTTNGAGRTVGGKTLYSEVGDLAQDEIRRTVTVSAVEPATPYARKIASVSVPSGGADLYVPEYGKTGSPFKFIGNDLGVYEANHSNTLWDVYSSCDGSGLMYVGRFVCTEFEARTGGVGMNSAKWVMDMSTWSGDIEMFPFSRRKRDPMSSGYKPVSPTPASDVLDEDHPLVIEYLPVAYGAHWWRVMSGIQGKDPYLDDRTMALWVDERAPEIAENADVLSKDYPDVGGRVELRRVFPDGSAVRSHGLVPDSRKINGQPLTNDITIAGMPTTGLVWNATAGKVKTADGAKTIGAADVGALGSLDTFREEIGVRGMVVTNYFEYYGVELVNNDEPAIVVFWADDFAVMFTVYGINGYGLGNDVVRKYVFPHGASGEYTLTSLVIDDSYNGFGLGVKRLDGSWNYAQMPESFAGNFAIQDWSSLRAMLADANSNTNADCECIKTNMCNLVHDGIVDTVNTTKSRFYDAGLGVEWTFVPDNGEFMFIATTNVNREVIQ